VDREKKWQEVERWEKIRNSRYNKWYGRVKEKGVAEYLKRGWKEERWQRVARFRLGDGIRGSRYWEGKEERKCRVCGGGNVEARVGGIYGLGSGEGMAGDGGRSAGRGGRRRGLDEEIGGVEGGWRVAWNE